MSLERAETEKRRLVKQKNLLSKTAKPKPTTKFEIRNPGNEASTALGQNIMVPMPYMHNPSTGKVNTYSGLEQFKSARDTLTESCLEAAYAIIEIAIL